MDKLLCSAIASELADIKGSHGKARREALARLDNIVTRLFPPVEGAPLPSEELNGIADIMPPLSSCVGASATYWCGPIEPGTTPITIDPFTSPVMFKP